MVGRGGRLAGVFSLLTWFMSFRITLSRWCPGQSKIPLPHSFQTHLGLQRPWEGDWGGPNVRGLSRGVWWEVRIGRWFLQPSVMLLVASGVSPEEAVIGSGYAG